MTTHFNVVLCLVDVAMKTQVISLNAEWSEKLLYTVSGEHNPTSDKYEFVFDPKEAAVSHTLGDDVDFVTVHGGIGDLTRLNTLASFKSENPKKYTTYLHLFNTPPLRLYNEVEPELEPWDTIMCFNPQSRAVRNMEVGFIALHGERRMVKIGEGGVIGKDWLIAVTFKRKEVGFPKGLAAGQNYLGLDAPLMTPPYRMGKATWKNYTCQCCGHVKKIHTNHEGSCWAWCENCSRMMGAFGQQFYYSRNRPFLPFQLAGLVLREGLEKGLATYADLTCMELARDTEHFE